MIRRTASTALPIALLLLGCTQAATPTTALLDARLDIAAALDIGTVMVSGSTNLPDRALIFVYVCCHDAR